MHTEEQAKEKWCPQSMAGGDDWSLCRASDCMAWRWTEEQVEHKTTYGSEAKPPEPPEGEGWKQQGDISKTTPTMWRAWWWRLMPNRQGRCGLSGDAMLTLNTDPNP